MDKKLIIGTRGSKLALWQANHLQSELKNAGFESELFIIKTKGDIVQHLSFDKIEGKGFFTKEIENALLDKTVDIAVHSLKDMPTEPTKELVLAGLSYREDPSDLLIIRKESMEEGRFLQLKKDAIIGTSSIRRKTQIQHIINEIQIKDLRGNVPTRIEKLRSGDYDAIILASAGIRRLELNLDDLFCIRLNPKEFIPAPGQGVVVFQCREQDLRVRKILDKIHHREVALCSNIERKVLQLMDGGCHTPLGVYCEMDEQGNYHSYASYAKNEAEELIQFNMSQSTSYQFAEKIVEKLKQGK